MARKRRVAAKAMTLEELATTVADLHEWATKMSSQGERWTKGTQRWMEDGDRSPRCGEKPTGHHSTPPPPPPPDYPPKR